VLVGLQQPDRQQSKVILEQTGLPVVGLEDAPVLFEVQKDGGEGGLVDGVKAAVDTVVFSETSEEGGHGDDHAEDVACVLGGQQVRLIHINYKDKSQYHK
jgi:hypothetical protein